MVKLLVLTALSAFVSAAQTADINAVRTLSRQLEQALIAADTAKLETILTDDFLRRPPGGRDTNKREYIALVGSGQLKYLAFENLEEKFRSYPNLVLVDDLTNIRARGANGPERNTKLKLTFIWVKLAGQWRLAGVQGSPVSAQ